MHDPILEQTIENARGAQPGHPIVQAFFHEPTHTASYVIHDPATATAAIVDSVLDYDAASGCTSTRSAQSIISYVQDQALRVEWLLETHAHADHLSAALYRSIRRLLALPAPTRIFVGHDYKALGRDQHQWQTTVGAQRTHNIHVHDGVSEEDFALMRTRRDAALPVIRLDAKFERSARSFPRIRILREGSSTPGCARDCQHLFQR